MNEELYFTIDENGKGKMIKYDSRYDITIHCESQEDQYKILVLLEKAKNMKWIPCSERQPDANGWYLTTVSGEMCGQDRSFSGMSEFANGRWVSGDDVDETELTLAWMPIPEPYKPKERKDGENHE